MSDHQQCLVMRTSPPSTVPPPSFRGNYIERYSDRRAGVVMISDDNRFLVVQSYNNKWGFPKGRLEQGETRKECAIRELYEETGIQIPPESIKQTLPLHKNSTYYLVQQYIEFDLSKIADTTEITAIGWVCVDCLRHMDTNCHVKKILELFQPS